MKRIVDTLSGDLFASIPQAYPMLPGAWNFRIEIAHVMGEAIKSATQDRYGIAADMGRLLGREVSVNTLDKYTSEAAEGHHPSLETAIAFDAATGQMALLAMYAAKLGAKVLPGKASLEAELGRLEMEVFEASKQMRAIKRVLEGGAQK
jgi:hypothetical protein